ncbi:hypothetical protein FACS1894172_21220 [Spirochaetia bacterium]|nr:hypothetical protein FACS1894172_21220 [Spirochaetia bacterium]
MTQLLINDVIHYVEQNIPTFHEQRLHKLDSLKLSNVIKKKNPYLFKAKYVLTGDEIVRQVTDAYISSSEEGIFGDWLEGLAIFVNHKIFKTNGNCGQHSGHNTRHTNGPRHHFYRAYNI